MTVVVMRVKRVQILAWIQWQKKNESLELQWQKHVVQKVKLIKLKSYIKTEEYIYI